MRNYADFKLTAMRRNRIMFQRRIKKTLGEEFVEAARRRLCSRCTKREDCRLLPVCSDGSDCLYFNKEGW